jgi:hypothetical protein
MEGEDVCVCMCVRDRKRGIEKKGGREGGREGGR